MKIPHLVFPSGCHVLRLTITSVMNTFADFLDLYSISYLNRFVCERVQVCSSMPNKILLITFDDAS